MKSITPFLYFNKYKNHEGVIFLFLFYGICITNFVISTRQGFRYWRNGGMGESGELKNSHIHVQIIIVPCVFIRVVDPEWFVSDPTPDPDPTFKEVSASDLNPVSDPGTLVFGSRELRGRLALYSWNYDDIHFCRWLYKCFCNLSFLGQFFWKKRFLCILIVHLVEK